MTRTRRGPAAWLALVVFVFAIGACSDDGADSDATRDSPADADGKVLFVAPGASGSECTSAAPCGTVEAAWAHAEKGDVIELRSGRYEGKVVLGPAEGTPDEGGIEVRGARRDDVRLSNVFVRAHDVVLHDVTIVASLQSETADQIKGFRLRNTTIDSGTVLVQGMHDAVVADNEFRNGLNEDALNVAGSADGVEVRGNVFHDYRWDSTAPNAEIHVDCIQVFGARNVTIEANRFSNCAQRAIIVQVSPLSELPTTAITVANNLIGGCDAKAMCQNREVPFQATGTAAAAAQGAQKPGGSSNYRIVNNLIQGYAFVEPVTDLVFANNIIQRYFNDDNARLACGAAGVGHNFVAEIGTCQKLSAGDRLGSVRFQRDPIRTSAFDISDPAVLGFADAEVAPPTDLNGREACGPRDVGPYELGCDN